MLDDQHAVPPFYQGIESQLQLMDIMEMQAGSGFIEDKQGMSPVLGIAPAQEIRQLDPLGFPARKAAGRLPQMQVAQAHILQDLQLVAQAFQYRLLGIGREKLQGLVHAHFQDFRYILAVVFHVQHLLLETLAVAFLAFYVKVRHELHLHFLGSLALAGFATPAFHIEGKEARRIEAFLGQRLGGVQFPDIVVSLDVRDRIGTAGTADRVLIH